MRREGVGDALRRAVRWLRVGGVLVDVQPEPTPLRLEVTLGGRVIPAGVAHDAPFFHEDMASARRHMRSLVARGQLRLVREVAATIRFTYETVDSWQSFMTRPRGGELEADESLLQTAVAAPDGAVTSIVDHVGRAYVRARSRHPPHRDKSAA